jgi:hypothetical protein
MIRDSLLGGFVPGTRFAPLKSMMNGSLEAKQRFLTESNHTTPDGFHD